MRSQAVVFFPEEDDANKLTCMKCGTDYEKLRLTLPLPLHSTINLCPRNQTSSQIPRGDNSAERIIPSLRNRLAAHLILYCQVKKRRSDLLIKQTEGGI